MAIALVSNVYYRFLRIDNNMYILGGSTTISATSSPGPGEVNDDSLPHAPMNIKEEEENRPPLEMSPRKKPRKQQLYVL